MFTPDQGNTGTVPLDVQEAPLLSVKEVAVASGDESGLVDVLLSIKITRQIKVRITRVLALAYVECEAARLQFVLPGRHVHRWGGQRQDGQKSEESGAEEHVENVLQVTWVPVC